MLTAVLRNELNKLGLGHYRIAKDTGLDYCSLRRFMKGEKDLTLRTAEVLMKYLGLEIRKKDHGESDDQV